MPLTAEQRRKRAQVAAYASHAGHDPRERTKAAGAATPSQRPYWDRKVRADFPDFADEAEYGRRAERLHKAYMARLALKSSQARAARKAATAHDGARHAVVAA